MKKIFLTLLFISICAFAFAEDIYEYRGNTYTLEQAEAEGLVLYKGKLFRKETLEKAGLVFENGEWGKPVVAEKENTAAVPVETTAKAEEKPAEQVEMPAEEGEIVRNELGSFIYYIYIPPNFNRAKKYPLIVGSHGSGQTGYEIINAWKKSADKRGYIVVAPTMPYDTDWDKVSVDKLFLDIVKEVEKKYKNINKKKVIFTGNSAGAGDTYNVGLCNPSVFKAAVPCSGRYDFLKNFLRRKPTKKIPVYILHGDKDPYFPLAEAYQVQELLDKKHYKVKLFVNKDLGHVYPEMSDTPVPNWIDNNFK
ncbi:dienelactone hydrolase family protein [bacterium]|jgi:dipeptidyl aminopeptidase/acylaminoacyl peptidase|nr:dienelactone hydrolase family protein [bacterium]